MPLPKAGSNSLFSNSFFIFIIRFFPSLANLLVVIWYSRHLSQNVYGSYQHFWIQLNVIYPLACFGIHVLIITYSRDFLVSLFRRLSTRHFALYAIWILALGLVFALLQGNAVGLPLFIPFLFIVSFSVSIIFESLLIVLRQYYTLSLISVTYSIAFCAIHWYVLKMDFSLYLLFFYLLGLSLLRLVIYWAMVAFNFKPDKQNDVQEFDVVAIRSLWLHLGVYDVSQILFTWVDKFVLSLVLTASLSAIYFNGSQNIPFLPLMLSAAGSAVLIQLASGNKANEREDILKLMNQSGKILSCVIFPVFFFLFLFTEDIIVKLFSQQYIASVPIFAVSVLVLPIRAYSFTTVLQRMHKGAVINAGAIADLLLACALMYPLYKWLGLPGVALSFVITTYLQAGFYLIYSAKLLQVSPFRLIPITNWIVKLIVFASLFIGIHYVGHVYFNRDIALILGGVAMVIAIAVSLLVEKSNLSKHGGI